MKKYRVRLLVPYTGLVENIISVSSDYPHLDLQVSAATLDEAVRLAVDAEQEGFDLIVSRGDTMLMIRKAVSIPVFGIDVTGEDLLRVISLADSYSGKWTFLGFPLIMNQAKSLCSTLHRHTSVHIIADVEECESKILSLKKEGYSLVVGDAVTVALAAKQGLNTILISSAEDSVWKVLDSVSYFCRYTEKYRNTMNLYQQIMSSSPRHTLIFDRSKNLVLYSGFRAAELSGQLLTYIDRAFEMPVIQNTIMLGQEIWKIESRQLDGPDMESDSYVAFFCNQLNNMEVLQNYCKKETIHLFEPEKEQTVHFDSFLQNSPKMNAAVRAAQKYAATQVPLLFIGEDGVEFDTLIHAVYQSGNYAGNTLIQLDCGSLKAEEWEALLCTEEHPLYELLRNSGYTVYLKGIEHIPQSIQTLLYHIFFETRQFQALRLLMSASDSFQSAVEQGSFSGRLYYAVSPLVIDIPPLRDRQEDFAVLCSLAIGEFNIKFGKSVAGIEESALEELKHYHWPGNFPQFNNAMGFLIKNAKEDYIALPDVKSLLDHYSSTLENSSGFTLDLDVSLEEMERAIIKYVFECEGKNSSKAAARLGIGRSTLWRKLKECGITKER